MVDSTPNIPAIIASVSNQNIKVATPDLIQVKEDAIPVEQMTDLMFEDIGGQEIISIARNDLINGQDVVYSPIKNAKKIGATFSPLNMFASIDDVNAHFKNFQIMFDSRVPEFGTNTDKDEVLDIAYVDTVTGDLIVNVTGMAPNEQVEVQIVNNVVLSGDIIY